MTTVVLAAGRSRRFGWSNKLLAPVGRAHRPVIAESLAQVLAATRGPVVLVVDHQAAALRRALIRHGVTSTRLHITHARGARNDMAQSRRHGLAAAVRCTSALQIHLADVIAFDAATLRRLRAATHAGAAMARPFHAGQPGHPVRLRLDRLALAADLHTALARLPDNARASVPGDRGTVRDLDYRQMIRSRI